MHSEEEIYKRFVGNDIRIISDLNRFGMSSSSCTHLFVRWLSRSSARISNNNLLKFIGKILAIKMFGTYPVSLLTLNISTPEATL